MRTCTSARRVVPAVSVIAMALAAAPAAGGPGTFGCKVTALRIGTTEIAVANPAYNPCQNSAVQQEIVTPEVVEGYVVTARALIAATEVKPRSAQASASALDLVVTAPDFRLEAREGFLKTSTVCVVNSQGKPTAQHPTQEATAAGIYITPTVGDPIEIVPGAHQHIAIPFVGTAHVMHDSTNDTRPGHKTEEVTMALLFLDVTNGPDITLLETRTDFSGQSCAPGKT